MTEQNTLVTDALMEAADSVTIEMEQTPEQEVTEAGPEFPQEENIPEPTAELSEVQKLINKRTGYWQVDLDLSDLKWVKNQCNNKFEFTGPNEAFMLMNCYLGFAATVAREEQVAKMKIENPPAPALQASAIEACALMLNRHKASGLDAAQRLFRIAVALNGPIMEMKVLDDQIAKLKAEEEKEANP